MAILYIGTYRGNFRKQMLWMMFWTLLYALVYFFFIDRVYALIQLGTCLTIPLLRLYNGERGSWKGMGKLFYAYYPGPSGRLRHSAHRPVGRGLRHCRREYLTHQKQRPAGSSGF